MANCSNPACNRSDLMQAQIRTYQCLACGAITNDDGSPAVPQEPGPTLSKVGLPVTEIGVPTPVALVEAGAPVEAVEEPEVEETPEVPEPEETPVEEPVEIPIDLSTLTPEQIEELKAALNG
jgi:hypothetical protein